MMQNRTIPKQANFISLNPAISPLELDGITIPKLMQPWKSHQRTAIVNNYGAAGSNAAIVLQEHLQADGGATAPRVTRTTNDLAEVPFIVSAKSAESLRSYCSALRSYVSRAQELHTDNMLSSLAYNLATKQNRSLGCSWSFTSQNLAGLYNHLEASAVGSMNFNVQDNHRRPIILCFGGQTGRTVHLCEDLFNNCRLLQLHMVRFLNILTLHFFYCIPNTCGNLEPGPWA